MDEMGAVAVVGIGCRFPDSRNTGEYWKNLRGGKDSITRPVDTRRPGDPPLILASGRVEGIDLFDNDFFRITPRDAAILDPQQRSLLEVAVEALEDSGYVPESYPGKIGVFVGVAPSTYLINNLLSRPDVVESAGVERLLLANDKGYAATRISYKLNLTGPSMAIDTACSSSLVALHVACRSLLMLECDMALAGGSRISVPHEEGGLIEEGGILSPLGVCKPFDESADGTVVGNGTGLIVLKRLDEAERDGDSIWAVIRGSAVNNDGARKVGFTAPSVSGQEEVIREAMAFAGLRSDDVSYVEAHGTGTALGDPIEFAGLDGAHRERARNNPCALGSVKSNIGHLDAAAGIAGVIKAIMALHNGEMPPSLNYRSANPGIPFAESPFYINTSLQDWPSTGAPRRCGVSSFGIGGTNAHAILEAAPVPEAVDRGRNWNMLGFSAKTPAALNRMIHRYADFLAVNPFVDLADLAYTLQTGRSLHPFRAAFVCSSASQAAELLQKPEQAVGSNFTVDYGGRSGICFLLPGQGSLEAGMLCQLYRHEALFRERVDYCASRLTETLGFDLRRHFRGERFLEDGTAILSRTRLAQPLTFICDYALAEYWIALGIKPSCLLGHSLGEYAAACIAKVFALDDALALIAYRSILMEESEAGGMLAVFLSEAEVLRKLPPECSLAAVNGERHCTISGPDQALISFQERMESENTGTRRISVTRAFHSASMDSLLGKFEARLSSIALSPPSIPFISCLTGRWISDSEAVSPGYWSSQLRQSVRFGDGMGLALETCRLFLETGPGSILSSMVKRAAGSQADSIATCGVFSGSEDEHARFMWTLGQLFGQGVRIDWNAFYGAEKRRKLRLPAYPFQGDRHWIEAGSRPLTDSEPPATEIPVAPIRHGGFPGGSGHFAYPSVNPMPGSVGITDGLIRLCQELFGIREISIHDNFYQLGGDSLLATQLASRARVAFRVDLRLKDVLTSTTLSHLADTIRGLGEGSSVPILERVSIAETEEGEI